MYDYKCLKDISCAEITNCLNLAFSDYALPLKLTEEQLQARFEASGVDKKLSYGAFLDGKMIGFIINSCCIYNNQKAVFDVGTGVIPEHRGNKVFSKLFAFTEQELQKHEVEKYYLEVLQQNDKTVQAYKKQGFTIVREFYVLKASTSIQEITDSKVEYIDMDKFDFNKISHYNYVQPSYEHSTNILKMNPNFYTVAYRQEGHEITAFCIFSKENGYIFQLGYTDICELKIIIQCLMSKFSNIIIKNIDKNYSQILETLYSIGFIEVAKQFEMVKDLYVN